MVGLLNTVNQSGSQLIASQSDGIPPLWNAMRSCLIMTPPLRNQHDQNSASNCIVHQISLCKNSLDFYFYNKICNETISFLVVGKLMETIYILRKRNKKKLPSSTPTSTTTSTDSRITFISLFPEPPLHPPGIVVKLHIQHHIQF